MNKNALLYDKISDDMFWLSTDLVLRMNVGLSYKNQDGTRRSFYSEYEYDSKYIDKRRATSIRRSFNYFMSLENIRDKEGYIGIYPSDIFALRNTLMSVSRWLMDSRMFIIVDGKLTIGKKTKPEVINFRGKTISFEPVIIRFSEEVVPGIRFVFNNGIFNDVSADKFMGFKYIIDSIDMYQAASNLINFVGIPPYGSNLVQIQSDNNEIKEIPSQVVKRQFKESKSYFDKLDNM